MSSKRLPHSPTFRPGRTRATRRLILTVLLTSLTLTITATAAADNTPLSTQAFLPNTHANQLQCELTLQTPLALIRMWLSTQAQGLRPPCHLTTTGFQPSDPPFGDITAALIQPLKTQGSHGHQLYVVRLSNHTKAATYIIDLKPHPDHHWLIDLWTQT